MHILGLHRVGYGKENPRSRHYHISAVGFQSVVLHPLLRRERLKHVVESLQFAYRQTLFLLVLLLRHAVKLVYVASRTYYVDAVKVGCEPREVIPHGLPRLLFHRPAEHPHRTDVVR